MNAIIGFSEAIKTEVLGPVGTRKYQEYAGDIHHSGEHLHALINDLLDMSKVEAGLTEVEEKWVAVSEIVNRSLTFVEFRAQARGIKFDLDAIDDGFEVWADERMMVQALSNLLSNAVKFSHHGGLVEIITAIMPDGRFEIRVEDRGIGVDAGDIENVFEPFWQAKSPLRSADEGIGLGLSIVRQLMDLHGGEVAMRLRDDGGAAVCLLLPKDRARKR